MIVGSYSITYRISFLMAIIMVKHPSASYLPPYVIHYGKRKISKDKTSSSFPTFASRPQRKCNTNAKYFILPTKETLFSYRASRSHGSEPNLLFSKCSTSLWSSSLDLQEEEKLTSSEPLTYIQNGIKQSNVTENPTLIESTLPQDASGTLDGRLICASQCAYNITQPYFRSVAYRPGTVAKRISRGLNSVLIGLTYDGIVIAFRGTQMSNPLDWIQNAALLLIPVGDKSGFKGKVHAGFYRATKSLWKPLKEALGEMLQVCDERGLKKDVYFTGHSKGGAMASLLALLMKRDMDLPDPAYVCTFASAKVGDSEFRDYYNSKINQTSYEAHLDIIPFLPPSSFVMENMNDQLVEMIEEMLWSEASSKKKSNYNWDYQTVGNRKFINEFGQIVEDTRRELDIKRIRDIEKTSFMSLSDFRAAHCSSCAKDGCYGYYFQAVAQIMCNMCEDDEEDETNEETRKIS